MSYANPAVIVSILAAVGLQPAAAATLTDAPTPTIAVASAAQTTPFGLSGGLMLAGLAMVGVRRRG